jgi:hypothetical protein
MNPMIGADFYTFWQIGQAILHGANPYAIPSSVYPPAASMLFAIFGLLPFLPSYAIWSGANVILFLIALRRKKYKGMLWIWFLFAPFLFNLFTGQLDVFFFFLAALLPLGGWPGLTAAVVLTLKPQVALVVLPWYLIRWLKRSPRLLLSWGAASLALNLLPIAFDPTIYQKWISALQGVSEMKTGVSSGLFSLTAFGFPIWLAALIAVPIAVWGLFQEEAVCRAAQLLAFPITIWYDDVLLAGSIPARWLVPYCLVAFLAAGLIQNALPLATIPLAALLYLLYQRKIERQTDPG